MEARIMPYSDEAEQSVLGCMLIDGESANSAIEQLSKEAFYTKAHQAIFEAMIALYSHGKNIDMVTVTEELRGMSALSIAGGGSYIADLSDYVPSASSIENYIQIVRKKHIRREVIHIATEAADAAYRRNIDEAAILERAEERLLSLSQSKVRQQFISFNDALMAAVDSIDRAGKGGGLKTGFIDFDNMTTGLWPGDYMILAARPSMGKTSLMLNIAYNIAAHNRIPIGIFSIEMGVDQLTKRILSEESDIPLITIRRGKLLDEQWDMVDKSIKRLKNTPLYIDEISSTPLSIRSAARRMASKHGIKLLMVDYLQLMHSSGKQENRTNEVANISRSFKLLAKELGIPIIVLSQLSRATETRSNKNRRPHLSDLRDSGAIEQDADIVSFLYRPAYYDKDKVSNNPNEPERAEWIIEKQRSGPTGKVDLIWLPEKTTFQNRSRP